MVQKIILPSYVGDNIGTELESMSYREMKDNMLDACKAIRSNGPDTTGIQTAVTNIPDKASLDDIIPVYTALDCYGDINRDDPKKTVYKPEYSDIAGQLDSIQSSLYHMALKIKLSQGCECVRVYDPMQELEFKNQLEKLMFDVIGFRDLLHLSLEGIRSDSVGLDEVENGIGSLYFLSEILTKQFADIQKKFFP